MLNIPFQVILPNIDETLVSGVDTEDVPELLAREKVSAVIHSLPSEQEIQWVLGADTVIIKDNRIFGKPQDADEAADFLRTFQNSTHTVITAIVLYNGRQRTTSSRVAKTKVTFAPMSEEEIQWYIESGEWHGAAGGYRIQSLASLFIEKIEGSQSCVTGLPIYELYDILKEQNYSILN